MVIRRDNQICLEFAFWKSRPPVDLGGIYEMRSYLLKVCAGYEMSCVFGLISRVLMFSNDCDDLAW